MVPDQVPDNSSQMPQDQTTTTSTPASVDNASLVVAKKPTVVKRVIGQQVRAILHIQKTLNILTLISTDQNHSLFFSTHPVTAHSIFKPTKTGSTRHFKQQSIK